MRAVLVLVLAGAGCKSDPTCFLEDVITDLVGAQELHDCGTADPTTPIATVQAIHDCVVADQTAHAPFRAVVNIQGIDSQPSVALLGITRGGMWRVFELDSDDARTIDSDHDPTTTTAECVGGLSDTSPCDDATLRLDLCLACDARTPIATCPAE